MDAQRFKDLACTSMSSGSIRRIAPSHESFCGNPSCDTVVITFQVQQLTRLCIRQGAMPTRLLFAKQQARTADVVISHVHCKTSANASMLFNKTRCAYAGYAYAFCCWTKFVAMLFASQHQIDTGHSRGPGEELSVSFAQVNQHPHTTWEPLRRSSPRDLKPCAPSSGPWTAFKFHALNYTRSCPRM